MAAPLLSPESPAASPLPTEKDIVAAPQEPPKGSESTAEIPSEVLELPVMFGLLNGAPPAVWAQTGRKDPEVATIVKNAKALENSGFGFYKSKDGATTVLYNGAFVDQSALAKADAAGTLTTDVPSYDSVKASTDAAISGAAPGGPPGVPIAPAAVGPGPSSKTQNTLATKRVNNLQVGAPTSGAVPGAGRILNNILKPTI